MGEKTQNIQPHKVEAIARLRELIGGSRDVIFTDYRGLNVEQITELRRSLKQQDVEYRVIRNNYARIALTELGMPFEDSFLIDPTAIALVRSDVGPAAKVIVELGRDMPVKIKGGMIEGRVASAQQVEAISRLPGREQLYSMLMNAMNGPLQNLAFGLNGIATKLVRTLQAVAEQKGT